MKELPRIRLAQPVIHGVLKLIFIDGYEGVVDLRPLIAKGKVFAWLQSPDNFEKVQIEEFGHAVYWVDETGYEIDFGSDSLRKMADEQAAMLAKAS